MLSFISKLFGGNKSDKDIKKLYPIVDQINKHFESYKSLTNDELRGKTKEFRQRISEHLKSYHDEMQELKEKAEALKATEIQKKEEYFDKIDAVEKDRDAALEVVLHEILPEAFAVMKETSRRFAEADEVVSLATDMDRDLSVSKPYITIDGDKAIYQTAWDAAGNAIDWKMVHYDVQLIGGIVLNDGKIAEMQTGEGKTLVSTLPAYLNALPGLGVHIVTVNDYLARRDAAWNGPIYEWLGLTVDCIDNYQPNSAERRNAYLADITYGTNNEFGFDYLRDNMVQSRHQMVQRKHHFAMIDEVDSVLIDDARTPLIISGPVARTGQQEYQTLKPRIEKIIDAQRRVVNQSLIEAKKQIASGEVSPETGGLLLYRAFRGLPKNSALIKYLSEEGNKQILQKAENYYIGEQQRHMPKVNEELYFTIDEKQNSVDLTDKGLALITGASEDQDFFVLPDIATELSRIDSLEDLSEEEKQAQKDAIIQEYATKSERIHSVQQLLKAYTLFEKDVEYVVMDGKVKIVDEQTGRVMDGRRYSDGLHQAIEAKENVTVEAATQTFATITLQNFFRMYHKLSGMTGTAETEAGEFWSIYELDVVQIPTNLPIQRKDLQDLVYKTKREKYKAIIDEVERQRNMGRPVLVGTTSVEVSELLSRMLRAKKMDHNVLNAKQHQSEAQIVAEAGLPGAVTIATNMAGRGTDIKLGEGVKEAGGLAIIGTERHESRRVDRQLRGRSGRQGDPGSSVFYVSLEDELMRLFGSEKIAAMMDKMGHKEGEVLQHSLVTRSIERAQKKVEENNFGIRKRLLEYDDVMNSQRDVIYKRRRHALFGDRLAIDLDNALYDVCDHLVQNYANDEEVFKIEVMKVLSLEPDMSKEGYKDINTQAETLYQDAKELYQRKFDSLKENLVPQLKMLYDQHIDTAKAIPNIGIPFTDGIKGINIQVGLEEVIETEGQALIDVLERNITLSMIDEEWKEHLRTMDDLRQSVQMASYEQKDPLLIYKFEAFELFKKMLIATNQNIISFLFRASIPIQQAPPEEVQQRIKEQQKQSPEDYAAPFAGAQDNAQQVDRAGTAYRADEEDYYTEPSVVERQEPIKAEVKIGRNEPCPCGSGKKFKHCHGANA